FPGPRNRTRYVTKNWIVGDSCGFIKAAYARGIDVRGQGWLYFWERTPGEYEAHGSKLCLRMKDNGEVALSTNKEAITWLRMNAGGMLNTCKSDGKWCFQWRA
ncbi:3-dehydroquinate synthase, partial [Striga asiatica]